MHKTGKISAESIILNREKHSTFFVEVILCNRVENDDIHIEKEYNMLYNISILSGQKRHDK